MPYSYRRNYETLEDIEKEFNDIRRHSRPIVGGSYNEVRLLRERAARERQQYLEELEFRDQMESRPYELTVDLRNKYQIIQAMKMLQAALDNIETEEFKVPYDPSGYYV